MIMASGVQKSTLVSQFWPRQVHGIVAQPITAVTIIDHQPRLLYIRSSVFADLQQVRIINVLDNRGYTATYMSNRQLVPLCH